MPVTWSTFPADPEPEFPARGLFVRIESPHSTTMPQVPIEHRQGDDRETGNRVLVVCDMRRYLRRAA